MCEKYYMNTKFYGLYIHIPFCRQKCYYCDFYSVKYDEDISNLFLLSLEEEIVEFNKKYNVFEFPICTLYIGGGTPSVFSCRQISELLYIITKNFNLKYLKEVNIEVNPESVSEEKLCIVKDFFEYTKLRLSLGVQSFNNSVLEALGRCHTSSDVYKAINIFDKLNIKNFNFDIIFGHPIQRLDDIQYDICQAVLCKPTHISCYSLTIEKGTKFYFTGVKVDSDLQAEMYKLIVELLKKNKYKRYEISNFAKKGYECLHNLNYWRYKEYIGLGPSAVSFFNSYRVKNVSSIKEYINKKFLYSVEFIDKETTLKEQIMLALRTEEGIQLNTEILCKYNMQIESLVDQRKLVKQNNRIKIAPSYMFLSNAIILEFI